MLSAGRRRRGVDDGASPGAVRAARVAGAVGTAIRAEAVLPVRGLRCPPGYWGVPAVVCRRTQSWAPMYVLDGAVVPVGRPCSQNNLWIVLWITRG